MITVVLLSFFVDLGIRNSVSDPERPWLLWSRVQFRQPREYGLSSAEEAPVLNEIEDSLTKAVKSITEAELVGPITTAGRREFYFYGADPTRFGEAVASAFMSFPDYEFDAGTHEDSEWAEYLNVLYPI